MMNWIKCSDRLPSKDGFYNIIYKHWGTQDAEIDKCLFVDGKWIMKPVYAEEIIFWIELPPIPILGDIERDIETLFTEMKNFKEQHDEMKRTLKILDAQIEELYRIIEILEENIGKNNA